MRRVVIFGAVFYILIGSTFAACFIHDSPYGYSRWGRIDSHGNIHDRPYGYSLWGRLEKNGQIHDKIYGYSLWGRLYKNGKIHDRPYSYSPWGRLEGKDCDKFLNPQIK